MAQRTDFRSYAVITLADGTELTVPESGFVIGGNRITDGAGADGLPLGVAVGRTIELSLMNDDDHLASYDFFGARIRLYLSFALADTTERIELGCFTVLEPESYGETVVITASDDMHKADRDWTATKTAPISLSSLFQDVCTLCGIPYSTARFANDDFVVDALPEAGACTCREMLGFIAMIAGGNARVNRQGTMEIIRYALDAETADHTLADWTTPATIGTDDILITGVQTVVSGTDDAGEGTETTILDGAAGYVLDLENPLWAGKETTGLALAGAAVIGQSLRKFEGEYIGYPIAEFMDTVDVVDRKGRHYRSVLTDIEFVFCGCTTLSCSAQSAVRNSSRYISAEAKALIEARKLVLQEKTARETAVSNLAERLTAAGGLYSTAEVQEDGSTIYYLHDKPTLAESQNVMKLTADVIGFSTDGGKNYPFGFAITGEAIMGIIQAEGVNTEWLKSGVSTMDQIEGLANEFEVTREGLRSEVSQSTGALQESLEAKLSVQDETIAANRDYMDQAASELRQTSTQLVQTSESLSLKVTEIINNGVSELHNEMGYDVDGTGFHVSRAGDEISATLNNHGLTVKHNEEKQLVADETGVDARNLHASTYLIIGAHSRMEDYGDGTGLFFTG